MPAVRDSKHNSLSASTETGTRQGRVNPDELVDDYSRLRPPRRNRRVSAAAATVAVAAVGVAGSPILQAEVTATRVTRRQVFRTRTRQTLHRNPAIQRHLL